MIKSTPADNSSIISIYKVSSAFSRYRFAISRNNDNKFTSVSMTLRGCNNM